MFAGAHQGEFDLILNFFDVNRAALGLDAHQRAHHGVGQLLRQLAGTGRGGALVAVGGQVGFGHGHGDLGRFKADHRAVASNHFVKRGATRFSGGR